MREPPKHVFREPFSKELWTIPWLIRQLAIHPLKGKTDVLLKLPRVDIVFSRKN